MGLVAPIWKFQDFGSQIRIVLGFSYFEFTIHYVRFLLQNIGFM